MSWDLLTMLKALVKSMSSIDVTDKRIFAPNGLGYDPIGKLRLSDTPLK